MSLLMDKNSLTFTNQNIAKSTQDFSQTRAKSFKVKAPVSNFAQYVKTVKAYALAGLPFEHIANAGDFLQDEVERGEVDASITQGWQSKIGEIAEDENRILAWQNRGETVSLTHQLPQAASVTGMEVVSISQNLVISGNNKEKTVEVLEGIAVVNNQPASLPASTQSVPLPTTTNSALESNPFLKAVPKDIKY